MSWLRRQIREYREGCRILASREFWREFCRYWSSEQIVARMDEWTARTRENLGEEPDWDVERRRAKRRVQRDTNESGPEDRRDDG